MAVELACRPNLPIHRNPIFLFANITFCPSAPNCSHSVSNVPSIFRFTHCAEGIYKKRPSRSEVRLCSMLMDRVQLCAGSPQMGPRSSFGSALGPLERVPKMSSLTLLWWKNLGLWKKFRVWKLWILWNIWTAAQRLLSSQASGWVSGWESIALGC